MMSNRQGLTVRSLSDVAAACGALFRARAIAPSATYYLLDNLAEAELKLGRIG
jgi:hypothetical protein